MTSHIQTPVKDHTGIVVGVNFIGGVGHSDAGPALSYFERQGYAVTATCPPDCDYVEPAAPAGKELTPKQKLQAEAKSLSLDDSGTAEALKARIDEHKANVEKKPEDPQTPPAGDEGKTNRDKGGE